MIPSAELRKFGWNKYKAAPIFVRALQALRPYICPIDEVLTLVPAGSSVLDVGCGTGGLLFQIAQFKGLASGIGIDTQDASIIVANSVAQETQRQEIRFHCLKSTAEWPAGPFDVVSVIDVLHHIPLAQQDTFLEACVQRVRPGGLFVYKDMAETPPFFALWNRAHDLILARQWIHYYPFAQACNVVTRAGFDVLQRKSIRRLVYQHELLVARRSTSV